MNESEQQILEAVHKMVDAFNVAGIDPPVMVGLTPRAMLGGAEASMGDSKRITAAEFDADPKAAFDHAATVGSVTILRDDGSEGMTIVIPRTDLACCDSAQRLAAAEAKLAEAEAEIAQLKTKLEVCL